MQLEKKYLLFLVLSCFFTLIACEAYHDESDDGNGGFNKEDVDSRANVVGSYQAEDHSFQKGCTLQSNHSGYTGSGFMDYGGNGSIVEWNNVDVSSAGQYTLTFHYANGSPGDRQASVTVNDTNVVGNVAFSKTGAWTTWSSTSISANLKAGNNKIRITANTNSGGPNLDKMDVTTGDSDSDSDSNGDSDSDSDSDSVTVTHEIHYYHLRITFSSTSKWAKLHIDNSEHFLRIGQPRITGTGNRIRANFEFIEINKPNGNVTISADYAVRPAALQEGLETVFGSLTKGSSGEATVSIHRIDGVCPEPDRCPEGVEIGTATAGKREEQTIINFSSNQGQGVEPKSAEVLPVPRMAWAVYYPWFRDDNPFADNNWEEKIADRADLRDRIDEYWTSHTEFKDRPIGPDDMQGKGMISYDPTALRKQVEQAISAGIDGFLPYYRGTTHFTHEATGLLLDAARDVSAEKDGVDFRIGLHISPQGAQENMEQGQNPVSLLIDWTADFVREYGDHAALMTVDSKPLAVVYSAGLLEADEWEQFRRGLDDKGIEVFLITDNGSATDFDEYIPHFDGAIGRSVDAEKGLSIGRQLRHNSIFTQERPKLWWGEVRPGFDNADRGEPKNNRFVDRENGAFFHKMFDEAEAHNPQWIRIVSWNEYSEHTHIEPSRDYGHDYLDIARDRIAAWKDGGGSH